MDINGSNTKPQTGGLKLMTVFIAVLALHVVVIGGFTVYHLMSGGSSDTDLATVDKTHKGINGTSVADGTLTDPTQDKTTAPTEVATIPATTVTPAPTTAAPAPATPASAPAAMPEQTAGAPSTPATTPAPATTIATDSTTEPTGALTSTTTASTSTEAPAPTSAPATAAANPAPQAPTGPIPSSLLPPAESAPISAPALALVPPPQPAPVAPSFASGPVHMPPAENSPDVPHERMKVYIVKITDSYKKIALKHHITVAQLKEANHITGNVLHTGQKLYIPAGRSEIAEKSQEKSATSSLAATPIVNESAAPMTTGLTSTSTTVATTEGHHHLYTVVKGDTLTKIAHRYKTTASAIMAENGITDPTKLSIGRKLRIPSSDETRSARAVPVTPQPSQVQAKTGATTAQLANYGN